MEIWEAYSAVDEELKRFASAEDAVTYAMRKLDAGERTVQLGLYFPSTRGFKDVNRRDFRQPNRLGGEYRYELRGWGIFWVQLEGMPGIGQEVTISVNTEKRAEAWSDAYKQLRDPRLWDWGEVSRLQRRLVRKVKSLVA